MKKLIETDEIKTPHTLLLKFNKKNKRVIHTKLFD